MKMSRLVLVLVCVAVLLPMVPGFPWSNVLSQSLAARWQNSVTQREIRQYPLPEPQPSPSLDPSLFRKMDDVNTREFREGNPEDYNGLELDDSVDHVMQRREWCARWGDNCVPDAKVKFAKCCNGLRCDCGSPLLGAGKCQCKKESLFGR